MLSKVTDVEGDWNIVDYPQHPECVGSVLKLRPIGIEEEYLYHLHSKVVNELNCNIEYTSTTGEWKISNFMSTLMDDVPEMMKKEDSVKELISAIRKIEVRSEEKLVIETSNGEHVQLERIL